MLKLSIPNPPPAAIRVTIEPLPELAGLQPLWCALEARAEASFFLSWHWIGPWLATLTRPPELLVARHAGQVVGLALLRVRTLLRHRFLPVRTLFLQQTGEPDQDVVTIEYNDILADAALADAVRRAALEHLLREGAVAGQRFDELVLGGITTATAAKLGALGRPTRELAAAGSAQVDLAALRQSGQGYLATLRPNCRAQIRRSLALYRRAGPLSLERARDPAEALDFFTAAGELHQARWTARGRPGAFAFPFYVAFHRRLIAAGQPAGVVELARIRVGATPVGYLYNFCYRGRVYYYLSGLHYEPDNRLKPGLVSHVLCIERHLAEGMQVYDFMAGDQRYKTSLGQPGPRLVSIVLQRPNLWLAAERPLRRLKQALARSG